MASKVKYHNKNRAKDLPSVFNEESTGLEVFIKTIIQEKLDAGISKEEILDKLKLIETTKENAAKCETIVKELLNVDVSFVVHDYYDWDVKQWKSKTADVGAFEDFFN